MAPVLTGGYDRTHALPGPTRSPLVPVSPFLLARACQAPRLAACGGPGIRHPRGRPPVPVDLRRWRARLAVASRRRRTRGPVAFRAGAGAGRTGRHLSPERSHRHTGGTCAGPGARVHARPAGGSLVADARTRAPQPRTLWRPDAPAGRRRRFVALDRCRCGSLVAPVRRIDGHQHRHGLAGRVARDRGRRRPPADTRPPHVRARDLAAALDRHRPGPGRGGRVHQHGIRPLRIPRTRFERAARLPSPCWAAGSCFVEALRRHHWRPPSLPSLPSPAPCTASGLSVRCGAATRDADAGLVRRLADGPHAAGGSAHRRPRAPP